MDVRERLKSLEIDPLVKLSLSEDLAKSWQRRNKIKLYISNEINEILKEIYEPIGMWLQNPDTIHRQDFGVIKDNQWSPLNQADTNYSGHCIIFNRCNKFLVSLYRKKNIETIKIDDEVFSYKNQIVFNDYDLDEEVLEKLKKIFKLIRYKKNEIFLYGSEMCDNLISLYNRTMNMGNEAQSYYEQRIYDFFDDLVGYTSSKGRGDYEDRKQGVDIWKNHKGYKTTDQVKKVCNIIVKDDYYFLDVAMSERSKCDFYVFVCVGARIVVFKNDKSKMIFKKDGVLIHKDLLHKEKFYDG